MVSRRIDDFRFVHHPDDLKVWRVYRRNVREVDQLIGSIAYVEGENDPSLLDRALELYWESRTEKTNRPN